MTKIILAGATGLIGSLLSRKLAETENEVHILGRRRAENLHDMVTQHIAANEDWPEITRQLGADIAISCLGTTIKQAGSRAAFTAVDRDLICDFAKAAKMGGARQMMLVSSVGADPASRNFYLKTKGRTERRLQEMEFDRLDIMQPGLLRGERTGPGRMGETIAIMISPLTDLAMLGPFARYRSTPAGRVADAMMALIGADRADGNGVFIHRNDEMARLTS